MSRQPQPTPRPGGRSARVRQAILTATSEQLIAGGYDALTVNEVAAAAGVAITTVYRRWPTKAELAAAALGELAATANPMPDTGRIETDLRALLAQILGLLRRPEIARLVRAVAAIDPDTPGADAARVAFWQTRFAGSASIVTRAIARGEIDAAAEPEAVIELLVGPAYLRLLLTGRPLDAELEAESLRRTLAAYAPDTETT
jgi:AcrR family transcriptional regulator